MTYFDNAATTPLSQAVRAAMNEAMEHCYGNPSSLHGLGLQAERAVKAADKTIRSLLGITAGDLLWTSGGTEANNLAVLGSARAAAGRGKRVITSAVEHPSVAEAFAQLAVEGFEVIVLPVDETGRVSPDALAAEVDARTTLVSIMHTNNETGIVQDIEALSAAAKERNDGVLFHTDAVQAFGKQPLHLNRRGVDLLTASAHKICGPKGTGFLYARHPARLKPLLYGGGQQKGIRPGTENVCGIAAMGAAAEAAYCHMNEARANAEAIRESLLGGIAPIEGIRMNSRPEGSPFIINLSVDGVRAEVLLHALESDGFFVSTGSACSSKQKHSQVLVNHGHSVKRAGEAIRISLGAQNTIEEAEAFVCALAKQVRFLRQYGGIRR